MAQGYDLLGLSSIPTLGLVSVAPPGASLLHSHMVLSRHKCE